MSSLIQTSASKTLSDTIRQSFFLKEDAVVSQALMDAFTKSKNTQQFESIVPHTQNNHTDSFTVYTTHDVDWINPHHPYSIANYIRAAFTPHRWLTAAQLWRKDSLLRNMEQLLRLENELGVSATYCLGATTGWQLGRYDIRYATNSSLYAEMISLIAEHNQSIGLHSSVKAGKQNSIGAELASLQKHTSQTIVAHRSHYLQGDAQTLYTRLELAGVKYELGNGAARTVGLTNGFPGKYKPVNQATNNKIDITIVPLILMDNVFFVKPYHEVMAEFKQTLNTVKQYNGSVCILFHPENMLLKPQLYNYFEEIIHICKQQGAILNTPLT